MVCGDLGRVFVTYFFGTGFFCQAQGSTQGPTQGRVKVKVKVKENWFSPPLSHSPPPSLNECLDRRVLSKSCLYHHDGPQNDQG